MKEETKKEYEDRNTQSLLLLYGALHQQYAIEVYQSQPSVETREEIFFIEDLLLGRITDLEKIRSISPFAKD